jgi:hypothetical protein
MEDRPYAVVVKNGITCFVLPRRARTFFQKAGGWCILGITVLVAGGGGWILFWLSINGGLDGHVFQWVLLGGLVVCAAALKIGWTTFRGGQGEIRVCGEGDFLRVTDNRDGGDWEKHVLSSITGFLILDAGEDFAPKDNMSLWAKRADGTKRCIVNDYPKWVLEMLAVDLEKMLAEAKTQPKDSEE